MKVWISRLRLFQFRNYADQTVTLAPGLNLISGDNAQGKTNLLEAVATIALTRSPRAPSTELVGWGAPAARVEARLERAGSRLAVSMTLTRGDGGTVARTTEVDGNARPARELLGLCPVVLFWPDDLLLVRGAPEGRRRLLDIALSQLDRAVAEDLVRYRRVLEQRNSLLRQLRAGTPAPHLEEYTDALVELGGRIQARRGQLVSALQPLAAAALTEIAGSDEGLELFYPAAPPGAGPDDCRLTIREALRQGAAEERARAVTVAGPHRDDLVISLLGRPAKTAGSQGQQRSVVLACKLAELQLMAAQLEVTPLLILDDVLSELDAHRRQALLHAAARWAGQVLVSGTEAAVEAWPGGGVSHLVVAGGVVSAAHEAQAS
jgi:DNA replication and repair protein RecF